MPNTAIRPIAYSTRNIGSIVLPAGVNLIQRRSTIQPHRKLNRTIVTPETTPIWQQSILQPSANLQQRFGPKETGESYIQPSISLDDTASTKPLLQSKPIMQQKQSTIAQQPQSTSTNEEDEDLALFNKELQETISVPPPIESAQLSETIQKLEQKLTPPENIPSTELSTSLEKITNLRSQVQEQEHKLQELHTQQEHATPDFDIKAKQALLTNLEHALTNTENELAHLEQQPNADTALIKQIKDQLLLQKRTFDQLKREHKELLAPKPEPKIQPINPTPVLPPKAAPIQSPTQPVHIPSITTEPNAINGTVTDTSGKLVTGAVVIVKSKEGRPLRALKTNQLGQFWITTALENGTYLLETESQGLSFDTVSIELKGTAVPPVAVTAK